MPTEPHPPEPPADPERHADDEPPPFLGKWSRVYVAVIWYLAGLIALFYWFSRAFAA